MYSQSLKGFFCRRKHPSSIEEETRKKITKHQDDVKIKPQRSCQIFGRKYPLTDSCTKHLEIGINIFGNKFYPQLILSDSRNNQLELSIVTWSLIVAEADNVRSFFEDATDTRDNINFNDVCVEFGVLYGEKVLKLFNKDKCMCMIRKTFEKMVILNDCIIEMHNALYDTLYSVEQKFKEFVTLVRGYGDVKEHAEVVLYIKESHIYDRNLIIDGELVALGIHAIITAASTAS
ncbi:uncharacterized protein LOC143306626 [Osmia lignaria lignaria]|uniref:uncharacterized protein LOC143306626 n=1 Tax=Osmia lignaria lignaria TaxID=1437193 RepID=UPI00402BAB8B